MSSGSRSAAVNAQLSPSASEDLNFQLTACTLGFRKDRNSGVGVEGRQRVAIPETCSVQCSEAESSIGFFSEGVLGSQGIWGVISAVRLNH